MKDVARSVVLGAAMLSPALLQACKTEGGSPTPRPDPTIGAGDAGATSLPVATGTATATVTAAPPTSVVRPRPTGAPTTQMPTRGFSGGARVRG
ncbi:MAG: hypothetical protein ACRELB_27650 [Polyangiaceae bacterium]